jgi:hypothetical protein
MKLTIQVSFKTPAGQQVDETVTTTIATAAAWERKFKRRASDLQGGIGIDDLMYMAWHALNAQKREGRDYDTWLQSVEDFSVVEVAGANPTAPAASDAS